MAPSTWRRNAQTCKPGTELPAKNPAALREENSRKVQFQCWRITCLRECLLFRNPAVLYQLEQGFVEVLHAIIMTGLDGSAELVEPIVFEHFSDSDSIEHDLAGRRHGALHGSDQIG